MNTAAGMSSHLLAYDVDKTVEDKRGNRSRLLSNLLRFPAVSRKHEGV